MRFCSKKMYLMFAFKPFHLFQICNLYFAICFSTEREHAAIASPAPSPNSTTKSGRSNESGRGGRKKYVPILYTDLWFSCRLFNGHSISILFKFSWLLGKLVIAI